jgi:hypothetical protein
LKRPAPRRAFCCAGAARRDFQKSRSDFFKELGPDCDGRMAFADTQASKAAPLFPLHQKTCMPPQSESRRPDLSA